MEGKKKSWMLRPIAWGCTMLMALGMDVISGLIFKLGTQLVFWLSGLSTLVIIFLVMALGSVYLGIVGYSLWMIPGLLVALSDKIYPSNHAFRYYFIGIFQVIGCVLSIILGAKGLIVRDIMFFFYVNMGHLAISAAVMIFCGHSKAEERNEEQQQRSGVENSQGVAKYQSTDISVDELQRFRVQHEDNVADLNRIAKEFDMKPDELLTAMETNYYKQCGKTQKEAEAAVRENKANRQL